MVTIKSVTRDEAVQPASASFFSFGDPVPVLQGRDLLGYYHSNWNGKYYTPPISFDALAKSQTANPHHKSAMEVKVNILTSCYRGHRLLPKQSFKRWATDFVFFGNGYLELIRNGLGGSYQLKPTLAKYTRVGREGAFWYLHEMGKEHAFKSPVFHLLEPDINQEIYGMPGYLAALNSALLNESATLFRRKYYENGSHAGFILYMTDPLQNQEDIDSLRKALKDAKGPGNFKNLFAYSPNGKPDGMKVIPIAEVGAKDEFLNVKNVTRDDILAAHRVPPQLMGIVPNNTGGFGSATDAAKVFSRNELVPLQSSFKSLNDWIGEEVMVFDDYVIEGLKEESGTGEEE
ncbi:phage portal protein [Kiloniella laminariae]|uniref:Phage portal protein n=1 Tax=Kiloniella laminariae TaxID=454162 RepID=A0ABT4LKT3_9PROT|nr:phage portal protein [Kiloniella laminariae]MCZ4281719.1 phage portal protein [Kiloniella laminariae]